MKINKLLILFIFTIFLTLVLSDSPFDVPTVTPSTPNSNENETTPTQTPTPTTPIPTETPTPTPTITTPPPNPYADGKMKILINSQSNVNYTSSECGDEITPCKGIVDGFQKFKRFKSNNSGIPISLLEFLIMPGQYGKDSFQELATKLNLYELNVNISFVGINGLQSVEFIGTGLIEPFIFISAQVPIKSVGLINNVTFSFDNIIFRDCERCKLIEVSIIDPSLDPNNSSEINAAILASNTSDQQNSNNGIVRVIFKRTIIKNMINEDIDSITTQVNRLGWFEMIFEDNCKFDFTSGSNIFNIKNTKLIFRNQFIVLSGRANEAFINAKGCSIDISNSFFSQYLTREGLLFTVDCSVNISNVQFSNNFGTFSSIIHYSASRTDLNITGCFFQNNMVTNNGGKGDSIIIIKNEGKETDNNHHGATPKQEIIDVSNQPNKASIINCTFIENNTPKSLDSGIIWVYNSILLIQGGEFNSNPINDHGPSVISHHSTVDIRSTKLISMNPSRENEFPYIVSNYSSIRVTEILLSPTTQLPFKCESSLILFDYASSINASLFVCNNIHREEFNSTYANIVSGNDINSFSCEIIQLDPNVQPPARATPKVICSNESHTSYKYDFRLTKAIIAIIVIACTFLTLIPVVLLANKIYKNFYRGYAPHESEEPDLEEFSINNHTANGGGRNLNDGFQDVLYEDETPANKSLLK
ncbi:hypothetical protein RB653_003382 [Dictyostelium firmibasis]|uniref:Uncharacterized protein n=1 Tax=Dictyostelium firmibasis TaxID=79012 RepID=A0AAN7TXQ6_9MYCE